MMSVAMATLPETFTTVQIVSETASGTLCMVSKEIETLPGTFP